MLYLNNIVLNFGSQKIFDHLTVSIQKNHRIGLVGLNGSGKSTLLKVITGMQHLDSGRIIISNGMKIAYMPQEVVLKSTYSILNETMFSIPKIGDLYKELFLLEQQLHLDDIEINMHYANVMHEYNELNGNSTLAQVKKMLQGFGFTSEQFDHSVSTLSVGWQMRIILAQLLLQDADFYLFDEPTNHLDIIAKDWFIQFLEEASFGFLLVCHEKLFLNKLCTSILELERGTGTLYHGNYTDYESQKAANLITLESAHKAQQRHIEQKQETIERFRAKASKARMAKSMEKQLAKIERIDPPITHKNINFSFPPVERAGRIVLNINNISYSFGEKKIFENISFTIERGEKVALIAPNGCGKTTLFNVIVGKYAKQNGNIEYGSNTFKAIFEQDQNKVLDPNKTIIQQMLQDISHKPESHIRTFLGSFLFGKEEISKKTKVLSGGEKNRVSMVRVLLQDANFLILDEPTNHLDIISKEILLNALQQYQGTILFVSHDHDFVNHLATRVLELASTNIASYIGNYDAYKIQKNNDISNKSLHTNNNINNQKQTKEIHTISINTINENNKIITKLEQSIIKIDQEIEKINMSFADLEYGTEIFQSTLQKLEQLQKQQKNYMQEWDKYNK